MKELDEKNIEIMKILNDVNSIKNFPGGNYEFFEAFSLQDLKKIEKDLGKIADSLYDVSCFISKIGYKAVYNNGVDFDPVEINVTKENARTVLSEFFDKEDVDKIVDEINKQMGEKNE